MPLPDLIEIIPLDKPVRAEITVPGSKSITNRALILAALLAILYDEPKREPAAA